MADAKGLWLRLFFGFAWLQFAILTGIATYLLLIPDPGDTFESFWDKSLHVICWFVLLGSLKLPCLLRDKFWPLAIALFLYSVLIEILQHFLPPRTFSLWDIFSNGLGVIFAYLLIIAVDPVVKRFITPLLQSPDHN